ncbi:class A beta-lactamase-related serine hydrolase [Candidatus Bathyarchaeota archaeon]|nr:class A beta-lactamase-related serine hydrolase [Candidatus Bathyarchaeota archaeon]
MVLSSRGLRVVILLLLLVGSLAQPVSATEIIDSETEAKISQLVDSGDIPSLHLGLVSGGNVVVKTFGDQTSEDTMFLIGSIQKVFVAISILQLYERGVIGLDDDVNDYLSFSLRHPDYPEKPITIRMLLSHRSGLVSTLASEFCFDWSQDYCSEVAGIPLEDYLSISLSENGSLSVHANWAFEPDTQYGYSNNGYKVLMVILERVSGQSISDYMQENIFGPLGMDNTGFNGTGYVDQHATPYTRKLNNSTNTPLDVWDGRYMLRSTAHDMGQLIAALCNDGQYDGYQLLQPETLELMLENTCPNKNVWYPGGKFLSLGYGLGLEVRNHGLWGHGGSTVGFTAEMYFNPSTDTGFVRLSNVNAILDYRSTEWQGINSVTNDIRTRAMVEMGMLPRYDYFLIGMITISLSTLAFNLNRLYRKRKASQAQ